MNVININKYKIFHNKCVRNLKIHLQQQQFVHIFPENKHIKRTKTARAIFINPKTPNINLNPSFPYSSIVSELSTNIPSISSLISLKVPFNSLKVS